MTATSNVEDAVEEAKSRMTLSEKERTLVSQARLIEKLEEKLDAMQAKVAGLQVELDAERQRLRAMVDGTDHADSRD